MSDKDQLRVAVKALHRLSVLGAVAGCSTSEGNDIASDAIDSISCMQVLAADRAACELDASRFRFIVASLIDPKGPEATALLQAGEALLDDHQLPGPEEAAMMIALIDASILFLVLKG